VMNIEGTTLNIKVKANKVSEVVRLLVKSDIDVDGVIKKERNLEDIFFKATETGGDK